MAVREAEDLHPCVTETGPAPTAGSWVPVLLPVLYLLPQGKLSWWDWTVGNISTQKPCKCWRK